MCEIIYSKMKNITVCYNYINNIFAGEEVVLLIWCLLFTYYKSNAWSLVNDDGNLEADPFECVVH